MNLKRSVLACLVAVCCLATICLNAQSFDVHKKHQPPMLGPHWAKGVKPAKPGSSPDMTLHGGEIMTNASVQAIFWGTSWVTSPGDKISEMDLWYQGFGGSNYAATSDEYKGVSGDQVSSQVGYGGHFVDTTTASGGGSTSAILAEVCKVIPNPQTNGYYPVYTDLPRKGNYCAYHSWGACNGVNVQFAFFWKLDGDAGCDPESTITSYSQGAAALANVSGHELSEARTDPRGAGWFDSSGAENGDKCAWTFDAPFVKFKNGTEWKIQGEWSNHAYDTGTGYPNSSGQKGCLQGQ
ncbi:MAG TPA: hypothetical protein VJ756_02995 [Terriglobales bacterium]|jgi:hypothetical protein|nr:hypothetical protein [Terriglobales bacterium]